MTIKTQAVEYHEPMGIVTISGRIARKQREIGKRLASWPRNYQCYGSDARRWATHNMANLLRHMANNLECQMSDPEIGNEKDGASC